MAAPDLVIRGARLAGSGAPAVDLYLAHGRVLGLETHDPGRAHDAPAVEAGGLLLLPGLTDCHVHLREPGQEWKEDVATGLAAAAHGGFANVMCMANTKPVNDDASVTALMLDKARLSWPRGPRLFPVGALTVKLKGEALAAFAELREAGCKAVSNDGLPVHNTELFRRAVEYASDLGLIVIDHCEDPFLSPGAGINEGLVSSALGLRGQPTASEAIQVARDCLLAAYLQAPIHLAHISCRQSVEIIARAKEQGAPVTAETCPHYLLLTEEAVTGYNTQAKVSPPLRTSDDAAALREGLRSGVIDIVSTDHAPHAAHEKETPFDEAPNGISGLDSALALTWRLVAEGALSEADLVRALTKGADIFGLPVNRFAPGDPADVVLFDPNLTWTLTEQEMRSKSKNTPFLNTRLTGRCAGLYVAGKKIV
ncbi:MAG: dihydroorotase [Desulfovibrionaceae bacterium]|nr:dihydroorotase [Desulfovibrionaceae bacterium]MBF0513509.1 dihydroorotase [Desulfovibrionaceae bacterium]